MEIARRSIDVALTPDIAHERWLRFTGQGGSPGASAAEVPGSTLPDEIDKGKVYFGDEEAGSTRVTMELRYNPRAVQEAGLTEDWVGQRLELYLRRFKEQAEKES